MFRKRQPEEDAEIEIVEAPKPLWSVAKVGNKVICEGDLMLMIQDLTKMVADMQKIAPLPAPPPAPEPKLPAPASLPAAASTALANGAPGISAERKAELKAQAEKLLATRMPIAGPVKLPG